MALGSWYRHAPRATKLPCLEFHIASGTYQGWASCANRADWGLLAAGAVVFGAGQLVPPYTESYQTWYPKLRKPEYAKVPVTPLFPLAIAVVSEPDVAPC